MLINEHNKELLLSLESEKDESISKTLGDVCNFYWQYYEFLKSSLLPTDLELSSMYEFVRDLQFANEPSFAIDRLCRPNWQKI